VLFGKEGSVHVTIAARAGSLRFHNGGRIRNSFSLGADRGASCAGDVCDRAGRDAGAVGCDDGSDSC
jgi:hypothetical protein